MPRALFLAVLCCAGLLTGCGKDDSNTFGGTGTDPTTPTDDTETTPDGALYDSDGNFIGEPQWSLFVDEMPQGMFTGAFTVGDDLLVAGGQINGWDDPTYGQSGFVSHIEDNQMCVDEAVSERALWWLHGDTPDRMFASGEGGTIMRYEDGQWNDESLESGILYGIFDAGERAWAVHGSGSVYTRTDADGWYEYQSGLSTLFKTWCAGPDQCVFVGNGRIYMIDGDEWREEVIGDGNDQVWTCRGRSWEDIWCVGGDTGPVMYHYDGADWEKKDVSHAGVPMFGIWVDNESDDIWVGGAQGFAAKYDEATNTFESEVPLLNLPFHAVWKHKGQVYFVGGNLGSQDGPYYGSIVRYGDDVGTITPTVCE